MNPREDADFYLGTIACRDDGPYELGDKGHAFDILSILNEHDSQIDEAEWAYDASEPETAAEVIEAIDLVLELLPEPAESAIDLVRRYLVEECGAIESTLVGLSLTDHSGLFLHVDVPDGSDCGDRWDTAFIGWAYTTKEAVEEAGCAEDVWRDAVLAEAKEYGCYLGGEVYTVSIEEEETGEYLDGCSNLIGYDYAESYAQEIASECHDGLRRERVAEATRQRRAAISFLASPEAILEAV